MQPLLDAVRATGATNVVLTSTNSYASDLSEWLHYKPNDSANQLATVWHAYFTPSQNLTAAQAIKAAGYPVIITQYGDQNGSSTDSSVLLPFVDVNNISYVAWAWDVWPGDNSFVLITDAAGDPTQGYGTYVKAHYLRRSTGTAICN
jgi:endoglucanase